MDLLLLFNDILFTYLNIKSGYEGADCFFCFKYGNTYKILGINDINAMTIHEDQLLIDGCINCATEVADGLYVINCPNLLDKYPPNLFNEYPREESQFVPLKIFCVKINNKFYLFVAAGWYFELHNSSNLHFVDQYFLNGIYK